MWSCGALRANFTVDGRCHIHQLLTGADMRISLTLLLPVRAKPPMHGTTLAGATCSLLRRLLPKPPDHPQRQRG
jgi:hypothetical protein